MHDLDSRMLKVLRFTPAFIQKKKKEITFVGFNQLESAAQFKSALETATQNAAVKSNHLTTLL